MNKAGKTTTIFLVVISVLLLSLTAISIFFFKKENELRKLAESKLAQAKALEVKLDQDLKEAKKQFDILEARIVHRIGHLNVGDMAVWIGVTAPHRDQAFKACRFLIDEIKKRLPIWKKEIYLNGDSGWVNGDVRM